MGKGRQKLSVNVKLYRDQLLNPWTDFDKLGLVLKLSKIPVILDHLSKRQQENMPAMVLEEDTPPGQKYSNSHGPP